MTENYSESPTVALIHGAFADAGSFAGVTELLLAAGVKVQALSIRCAGWPSTPPTSPAHSPRSRGPVLAVGHSYGGAIITNAATSVPNVVGLVFVSGFAPDENETTRRGRRHLAGQRARSRPGPGPVPDRNG